MKEPIKPKLENANKGFNYTVTPEQLEAHQKWSLEDRLRWIWDTNVLLSKIHTPEERERGRVLKHKINR
jgi:hypothetical protein